MVNDSSEIILDLTNESLFWEDSLSFNCKKNNIVFGKNGTGKTTICKLISGQIKDWNVRVFDGFNNIIDSNQKLNAVVLGEENVKIRKQIDQKNYELSEIRNKKEIIEENLREPEDESVSNLWTKRIEAENAYKSLDNDIENLLSTIASEIKNKSDPQIAPPNYNKKKLKNEIDFASNLSDEETDKYIKIINSEKKDVKQIQWPQTDYSYILELVNEILNKKVEAHVCLERLEGNPKKINFAKEGLRIHEPGEVCAFCGSTIKKSEYEKLNQYFSADEVKDFQKEIKSLEDHINEEKESIRKLEISPDDFYENYMGQVTALCSILERRKDECLSWLNEIGNAIEKKKTDLFECSESLQLDSPEDFSKLEYSFENLREDNNSNELSSQRDEARKKLRYSAIATKLSEYGYQDMISDKKLRQNLLNNANSSFDEEQKKISGDGGLNEQINTIERDIINLQAQTKNEKVLAEHINRTLHHLVAFEIVHCDKQSEQGYYAVNDLRTNQVRDITKLSTGEKNIIAFLYFIEKLNEVNDGTPISKKLIVFDDPMTSNDDGMQYLIMEELCSLMKSRQSDCFIILTHNKHFYLNLGCGNNWKKFSHIHLITDGKQTHIKRINEAGEDFKTSYDSFWHELKFLYSSKEAPDDMLLNPMRRIIETYTKFNALNQREFCEKVVGAKKLFDVNSHSIDDFEAELNGKNKDQILAIFKDCFKENGAISHYDLHWNGANIKAE